MDQPQPCTKCRKLPEDILMLACSHDLCLDCASERLAFEMKKKKPANSIVCEICYERTALDAESVAELEKLIPTAKTPVAKSYAEPRQPYDRVERVVSKGSQVQYDEKTKEKGNDRQPIRDYSYVAPQGNSSINSALTTGISSKKSCGEHPDEQILYYCFDCKCECICPECVIHGKHKDHDVKTIKKSAPIIRSELQKSVDKLESNIESLLIKKSEAEKNIRTLNDINATSKRQVQSAFEEVRAKLAQKEKEVLANLDLDLNRSIEDLEKSIKSVLKRIEDLKGYSTATSEFMKKEDLPLLNFYAKRWKEISDQSKQTPISIPAVNPPNNERLLSSILELTDHTDRVGSAPDKKRNNP